jgi:hypothetical protein
MLVQAILSQFSQKRKIRPATEDADQEEELDDATLFKDLLDDDGVDEEEDAEPEDDDEVDPAVDGSDDRAIAEAIEGVDYSNRAPILFPDDVKLGHFSIFKVYYITGTLTHSWLTHILCSFELSQTKLSTARLLKLTSKHAATVLGSNRHL